MPQEEVTIVVVPRERFSATQEALERLYEHTDVPFNLVYIDGGSPSHIRDYLAQQAAMRPFRLVRTEHYLTPNKARNLGLRHVDTDYVVFVDNDVLVHPGWLSALLDCARETEAWAVMPLYMIAQSGIETVHMAGGPARFEEREGRRILVNKHRFQHRPLAEVADELRREPVEFIEFHTVLVRTNVFEKLGPLDEALLSSREHLDLSLAIRDAGGSLYFEPASMVGYNAPPPFALSDLPYYFLRWSEAWNRASLRHFYEKWDLGPGYEDKTKFLRVRRQKVLRGTLAFTRRTLGPYGEKGAKVALSRAERTLNELLVKEDGRGPLGRKAMEKQSADA